jgi:3-oxoacyl-[acyl-carrier-protein] synthase-3
MTSERRETAGIASIGYYIPRETITIQEISQLSKIPLEVFIDKIGMEKKHVAGPDEQPSDMGIRACKEALKRARVDAGEIGIIVYCGASFYDYRMWSPSACIQAALDANNCYAFEVKNGCNGGNLGINLCRNLLLNDPTKKYGLVVCSEKLSSCIDYTDPRAVSLFTVGDGAAAAVISKGTSDNQLLEYASRTDGTTVDSVKVPMGGTKMPSCQADCDSRSKWLCVDDPEGLDRILSETYLENYVRAISEAVSRSGYSMNDIDFLFTNQVKKSLSKSIFQSVGLSGKNTLTSIEDYGHMGTFDTLFNLCRAKDNGLIKPGDLVVIASSGAGFTWAALALKFLDQK